MLLVQDVVNISENQLVKHLNILFTNASRFSILPFAFWNSDTNVKTRKVFATLAIRRGLS